MDGQLLLYDLQEQLDRGLCRFSVPGSQDGQSRDTLRIWCHLLENEPFREVVFTSSAHRLTMNTTVALCIGAARKPGSTILTDLTGPNSANL
jgi:hypothetical protein